MQASLFQGGPEPSGETLADIYQEELERGKLMFPSRQFVFGTGNEKADVVVIGESPGHPDELYDRPFMGPAGELLVRILSSIGLTSNGARSCGIIYELRRGFGSLWETKLRP